MTCRNPWLFPCPPPPFPQTHWMYLIALKKYIYKNYISGKDQCSLLFHLLLGALCETERWAGLASSKTENKNRRAKDWIFKHTYIVSWEPEGCYCSSKMFRWVLLVLNGTSLNYNNALLALNWRYIPQTNYIFNRHFTFHWLLSNLVLICSFRGQRLMTRFINYQLFKLVQKKFQETKPYTLSSTSMPSQQIRPEHHKQYLFSLCFKRLTAVGASFWPSSPKDTEIGEKMYAWLELKFKTYLNKSAQWRLAVLCWYPNPMPLCNKTML